MIIWGEQFDRELGERFLTLGESGTLEHIVAHSEPGIPLQTSPNCGPTIVIRRHQQAGDKVYCRVGGSEAELHNDSGRQPLVPTGQTGTATDLASDIDGDLIERLLDTAQALLGQNPPGLLARLLPGLAGR